MSEKTANAGHKKEYAEVCIGQMIPTEKGIEMPPQYAYRIDFREDDVMVIPLISDKKQEKARQAKEQKDSPAKTRRKAAKVEEGREEA